MELSREFIARIRTRRNKYLVDDNPVVYQEPDCPNLACQKRGTKWECYQGLYEECGKSGK